MNKKEITYNQFVNLLSFISLLSHSQYILELSPEYLIEKYEVFFEDISNISDNSLLPNTLHQNIRTEIIEKYLEKWSADVEVIKRVSKINKLI